MTSYTGALPADSALAIFDVLVHHAGVSQQDRYAFSDAQASSRITTYPIGGTFGPDTVFVRDGSRNLDGSEVWRVSAPSASPAQQVALQQTNDALAALSITFA